MKTLFCAIIMMFSTHANYAQSEPLKTRLENAYRKMNTKPVEAYQEITSVYVKAQGYYKAKALALLGRMDQRKGDMAQAYSEYSEALDILFLSDTLDHYLEQVCYNNWQFSFDKIQNLQILNMQ